MVLSSYPVGICFSGNLPLFVGTAAPNEVITVQLKKGAEIILEDSFNPDEQGAISVDYSKVVDGLLTVKVPPFVAGSYIQAEAVAQLTAKFISSNGSDVETIVFNVVKGGVAGLANHSMFLASNFLTWQPQTKEVKYHDPEFLTYYATVAVTVKLKAYYSNTNEVVNVANLTANNLHTINLNYGSVASLLSGQALYYDVWVEDVGGNALTSVQRYVLIDKVFDYESILLFENSVGGIDTIRLTGQIEEKNTATVSSGLFEEFVFEFDTQPERGFTINSGYLKNEREKQWSAELLNSIQKYLIIDGALTSVYSDKPEFTAIKGELPFFEITLLCSRKTKYLNLARQTNPLPNLTISTNTGDVFFLAPRLNELPWANSNDVLLPVQFPYEDFFRKISLSAIIGSIGGGIIQEEDPTVPNHVKAITSAQINKWDNAAVSTDYFTKGEIASILNGSRSLEGYNKANWDAAFAWGNHFGLYQPLENQRLGTANEVTFRGINAQDFVSIPTAAPAAGDRIAGRHYIYSTSAGGSGSTPPSFGYLTTLQDVDTSGLANGVIIYYDAASAKFKFKAPDFPPSDQVYTKTQVNDFFSGTVTIGGYNKVNWDYAYNQIANKQDKITAVGFPYWNGTHMLAITGGANDMVLAGGGITSINPRIRQVSFTEIIPTNSPIVAGDRIQDLANKMQGQINHRANIDGGNATGTWGINITGNAQTASYWGGRMGDLNNFVTGYGSALMIDGNDGVIKLVAKVTFQNWLNVNDGSTLNNNISGSSTTWAGKTGDLTNVGVTLSYLYGSDYSNGNEARAWDASQVKNWLGLPSSGGYDLQSVTERGYTTDQPLVAQRSDGDGSNWPTAHIELRGSNPGLAFHYPNTYGASLYMNSAGVLNWSGAGAAINAYLYTNGTLEAANFVKGQRLVAGYDSGIAGSVNASGWFRLGGVGGLSWDSLGLQIQGVSSDSWYIQSGSGSIGYIGFKTNDTVNRGWLAWDNANNIGFLKQDGTWGFKLNANGDTVTTRNHSAQKLTASTVEASAALIIPNVPPATREAGKHYLYSVN